MESIEEVMNLPHLEKVKANLAAKAMNSQVSITTLPSVYEQHNEDRYDGSKIPRASFRSNSVSVEQIDGEHKPMATYQNQRSRKKRNSTQLESGQSLENSFFFTSAGIGRDQSPLPQDQSEAITSSAFLIHNDSQKTLPGLVIPISPKQNQSRNS